MTGYVLIGGIVLIVALLGLAGYALYRTGREDGYEEGRADAYGEILGRHEEERIGDMKAGRHAKSQPRADLPLQPAAVPPDPKPGPARLGGAISVFLARHMDAVTAENIDTVLLADPSPAPPVNGTADTGTMTKVSITSTGDMPVLTDSFIADLELREAAYRKEHAESEA